MDWVVALALVVVLLAAYLSWTAGRVERLHARVDRARAALDTQLDRRAVAAVSLAEAISGPGAGPTGDRLRGAARAALDAAPGQREPAENDLTRALRLLPLPGGGPALAEVTAASTRVALARQFYNDAVRDTLALRRGRLPRAFRLAARRPLPGYFDIDTDLDTSLGTGVELGGDARPTTGPSLGTGASLDTGTGAGLSRSS